MRAQLASILMLVLLDPELGTQLLHPDVQPTQLGALKCCFEPSLWELVTAEETSAGGRWGQGEVSKGQDWKMVLARPPRAMGQVEGVEKDLIHAGERALQPLGG